MTSLVARERGGREGGREGERERERERGGDRLNYSSSRDGIEWRNM